MHSNAAFRAAHCRFVPANPVAVASRRPHTRTVTQVSRYRYLGPPELRDRQPGVRIEVDSPGALSRWLACQNRRRAPSRSPSLWISMDDSGSHHGAVNTWDAPTAPRYSLPERSNSSPTRPNGLSPRSVTSRRLLPGRRLLASRRGCPRPRRHSPSRQLHQPGHLPRVSDLRGDQRRPRREPGLRCLRRRSARPLEPRRVMAPSRGDLVRRFASSHPGLVAVQVQPQCWRCAPMDQADMAARSGSAGSGLAGQPVRHVPRPTPEDGLHQP